MKNIHKLFFPLFIALLGCGVFSQPPHPQNIINDDEANSQILFVSERDGNREIYITNSDGSGVKNLTNNPSLDMDPRWSPDGTKIAFTSDRDGNSDLYIMNPDGSGVERLTENAVGASFLSWFPDSIRVAYLGDSGQSLYSINTLTREVNLVSSFDSNFGIAWDVELSPNGESLAFVGSRDDGYHVFVMGIDGTNVVDLSIGWGPSWSPDSKKIAFHKTTSNALGDDIFVIDVDGNNETQITSCPCIDQMGSWSPDGKYITFISSCWGGMACEMLGDSCIKAEDVTGSCPNRSNNYFDNVTLAQVVVQPSE